MRWSFLILATILFHIGCSGEDFPETFPVTGTVMLDGKPVEGATVTLIPGNADSRSASGDTDAEGKFAVKTYFSPQVQSEGVMPGNYTVTVTKVEKREIPEGLTEQQAQAAFAKMGPPKSLIPAKYQNPRASGLSVEVGTSAPEPMKIDL